MGGMVVAPTVASAAHPQLLPQTITLVQPAPGTAGYSATLYASGGLSQNPVFFTLDPLSGGGVCSLSGNDGSTVTYLAKGSCVVDANQAGDGLYAPAPTAVESVSVNPPPRWNGPVASGVASTAPGSARQYSIGETNDVWRLEVTHPAPSAAMTFSGVITLNNGAAFSGVTGILLESGDTVTQSPGTLAFSFVNHDGIDGVQFTTPAAATAITFNLAIDGVPAPTSSVSLGTKPGSPSANPFTVHRAPSDVPTPVEIDISDEVDLAGNQWIAGTPAIPVAMYPVPDYWALESYIYGADFVDSALPFTAAQIQALDATTRGGAFVRVPTVAAAVGVLFNLSGPGTLSVSVNLPPKALCGIFTGTVTLWSDPLIAAANPGVALPDLGITPVIRADSNPESFVLSAYCDILDPQEWAAFTGAHGLPDSPTSVWPSIPNSFYGTGDVVVANAIHNTDGSIGWALAPDAATYSDGLAAVQNASAAFIAPSAAAVDVALTQVSSADGYWNKVVKATGEAYPLTLLFSAIAQTKGFDPQKGLSVRDYLSYAISVEGQSHLQQLGYAPLTPNLLSQAAQLIGKIP